MALKLYNTLSQTVETFTPLNPDIVLMYSCGPTVYGPAHVGNLRSFVMADLLRRSLEYSDFKVKQVMNITDVDDKTIKASREASENLQNFTQKFEQLFITDSQALNIEEPALRPRATDSIAEMITLINELLEKKVAYTSDNGVYFKISEFSDYGSLAHLPPGAESKSRTSSDNYDKNDPRDFALWKFSTPEDGHVAWEAPFGAGRPGWHIECSAMALKHLGQSIDLHTGGIDLIFPHHTNERAQAECISGQPFVRYWFHNNFVNVEGKKMSKSFGNFLTLESLREKEISPLAFRYWLLTAHYRTEVNLTWEALQGAATAYSRLQNKLANLDKDGGQVNPEYQQKFTDLINNDLNIPSALALVWTLLADKTTPDADKRATILDFDRVLGLRLSQL
ncbi:MAG: cysteine--tRNA ligase [Candidatus Vogelbacteria bacterium]|nr:cysteine--tRNA ligase [Candidatus Vogelbacteria bacterium]